MKARSTLLIFCFASVCAWSQDNGDALYAQALELERAGKGAEAVKMYRQAARAGNAKAAKRLQELFDAATPKPKPPLKIE